MSETWGYYVPDYDKRHHTGTWVPDDAPVVPPQDTLEDVLAWLRQRRESQ